MAAVAGVGGDASGVPMLGAPGHYDRRRATAAATPAVDAPLTAWEVIKPPAGESPPSVAQVLAQVGEAVVDAQEAFDERCAAKLLPPEEVPAALQALGLPSVDLVSAAVWLWLWLWLLREKAVLT